MQSHRAEDAGSWKHSSRNSCIESRRSEFAHVKFLRKKRSLNKRASVKGVLMLPLIRIPYNPLVQAAASLSQKL